MKRSQLRSYMLKAATRTHAGVPVRHISPRSHPHPLYLTLAFLVALNGKLGEELSLSPLSLVCNLRRPYPSLCSPQASAGATPSTR